jgi:hypothetical protein
LLANVTGIASNSINWSGSGKPLSKPLSFKERGFEFSPFRASEASSGFPLLKGDGRGI